MDDNQLAKLPKWAQSEIKVLTNHIEYLENMVAQLTGTSETPITWTSGIHDEFHGLPEHATVTFVIYNNLGNKTEIDVRLDPEDRRALKVASNCGRISIEPGGGSNEIVVRAIR